MTTDIKIEEILFSCASLGLNVKTVRLLYDVVLIQLDTFPTPTLLHQVNTNIQKLGARYVAIELVDSP